jgi:hypothetical protein
MERFFAGANEHSLSAATISCIQDKLLKEVYVQGLSKKTL